jgi:hypothetical protein
MYNHSYILYLRKLYDKPIPVLQPNIQIPTLKTSENTYQTQQSKSQAENQTLMHQYNNNMTPQQKASSSVSLGNLKVNGISNTMITPNKQVFSSPHKNIVQPLNNVNTFNNKIQTPQIPQIPQNTQITQHLYSPIQNVQLYQNNSNMKSNAN